MDLPTWVQFLLTLAGGFIMGLATAWVAVFRRQNKQEGEINAIRLVLATNDVARMNERLQSLEQIVVGPRGGRGLMHRVDGVDDGIEYVKRALQRVADKLGVELPPNDAQ